MVKYYFRLLLAFLLFFPMGEALAQWEKGSYPNLDALARRDATLKLRDSLEQAKPNDPRNKVLGAVHVPKAWLDNYQSLCKSLNKNSRVLYRTWDGRYALVASFYTDSQLGDEKAPEGKYHPTIAPNCDLPRLDSLSYHYLSLGTPYPINLSDNIWKDMRENGRAAAYRPFSASTYLDSSVAAFYSVDLSRKNVSKLLLCTPVSTMHTEDLRINKSHLVSLADVPEEDAGDGYTCAIDTLNMESGSTHVEVQTLLLRLDGATLSREIRYGYNGQTNHLVHKDRSIYTIIEENILLADSSYYAQPISYDISGKKVGEGALIYTSDKGFPYDMSLGVVNPESYFIKIPSQLKMASKQEIETAILGLGNPISEYADLFSVQDMTAMTPPDRELYHTAGYKLDKPEYPDTYGDHIGSILVRVNVVGYHDKALVTEEGDVLTLISVGHDGKSVDNSSEYEGQLLLRVYPNYVTELRKKIEGATSSNVSRLDANPYFPARSYFFTSTDVAQPQRKQLRKVSKPQGSHFTIKGAVIVYKVGEPNSTSDN